MQNLDTDEVIDLGSDTGTFLGLDDTGRRHARIDLIRRFETIQTRQHNQEWDKGLALFLRTLVDNRCQLVETWIEGNLLRFPSENADISRLKHELEGHILELKCNAEVCGAGCDSCHLSCLLLKRHDGAHDCMSNHQCLQACEFEQHNGIYEPCGFK